MSSELFWKVAAIVGIVLLAALCSLLLVVLLRRKNPNGNQSPSVQTDVTPLSPYRDEDTLDAYNAIVETRREFCAAAESLEDPDTSVVIQLENFSILCASLGAKLRLHVIPTVDPVVSGLADVAAVLYDDFSAVVSHWVVLLKKEEADNLDDGVVNYMIHFAINSVSGDPLRRDRELKFRREEMAVAVRETEQRMNALWGRFHGFTASFDAKTDRLAERFGWTMEDDKSA